MKVSMSVMIIFTTLFCVLPFAWFMLIGKNNTRKKEKLFKNAVKNENLSLTNNEQWNNNFIGIDEAKNMLVFIKLINQEISVLKIDLKRLKSCQIDRETRDFKKDKKVETELQSLDLDLSFHLQSDSTRLNFYNINEQFSEDLEMKRAEKWQTLIQHCKLGIKEYKKVA